MRPRILLPVLALVLGLVLAASPRAALALCSVMRGEAQHLLTDETLAEQLRGRGAGDMRASDVRQTSLAQATVRLVLNRPDAIDPAEWKSTYFEAVAWRAPLPDVPPPGARLVAARVQPPMPGQEATPVTIELFSPSTAWWPEQWQVAVAACTGSYRELTSFAVVPVSVSSLRVSVATGIGSVALLYLMLALVARSVHARQLRLAEARSEARGERRVRPWLRALSPVVICQDSFGVASLSRFQVLLFTLTVVGVYAYVMMRTGRLASMSSDVLLLLGITMAGSTLARLTEGPVLSAPNRLWLMGTGVLDRTPRLPCWQDLLAADGEIDVTRVQAMAFSAFAAVALVLNGAADLEGFTIPEQLNYLLGLSQVVYVAGKALPRETAKRLNEEVDALVRAERRAIAAPDDAAARADFDAARAGTAPTLADVFGDRFEAERLARLQPGERLQG